MTIKQDLKVVQKEFKEFGKKVEKLTRTIEKSEKAPAEKDCNQANQNRKGETKNDDGKETSQKETC